MRATLLVLAVLTLGAVGLANDGSVAWPIEMGQPPQVNRYTEWRECWIQEYPDRWCIICIEHVCVKEVLDEACLLMCTLACLATGKLSSVCGYLCGSECVRCDQYRTTVLVQCYDLSTPRPMYYPDPDTFAEAR